LRYLFYDGWEQEDENDTDIYEDFFPMFWDWTFPDEGGSGNDDNGNDDDYDDDIAEGIWQ